MKVVLAALLGIAASASVSQKSSGIDYKALHEGSHWRKAWPEGIDDGTLDDEVFDAHHNYPFVKDAKVDPPAHTWYTFEPHTVSMENEF